MLASSQPLEENAAFYITLDYLLCKMGKIVISLPLILQLFSFAKENQGAHESNLVKRYPPVQWIHPASPDFENDFVVELKNGHDAASGNKLAYIGDHKNEKEKVRRQARIHQVEHMIRTWMRKNLAWAKKQQDQYYRDAIFFLTRF